jgi:aspartyl-tRNA(Asn)/glutamyl-tRNA(Gln) amidotransferase subunit A
VRALDAAAASELGAFWALDRDGAEATVAHLEAFPQHKRGRLRLGGVPVAVKDCFDVAGLPTSCGVSGDHEHAQRDADAVRRLREAGAVIIGKTAMDQLGWSLAASAPGFAPCLNPVDAELSPGGSSCGSAAAVAAGIATLGIGTDVAGSIRVPAAFCGIVGLKPPFGSVPLEGTASFVPSFDLAGVLARSVRECVEAYEVMADQEAAPAADGDLRIALIEDQLEAADPEIAAVVERAVEGASRAGLELGRVRLDWVPPRFGRVLSAELARTWGDEVERTPERFTADIRRSVAHGRTITDADLDAALLELAESAIAVERRLSEWDVLVGPTVPMSVPSRRDPGTVAELTAFTRPFSALHWPAFSVPGGVDASGRPVGVQLAASEERFGALVAAAELVAA